MPRKDHFAVTLALHNVSSLQGGPKRPKDKSKDTQSTKGKEKEKPRSKWRPSISASVNDFAERSSILSGTSVVPSIAVEEASIMTTSSGDGRRYSSSTASTITAKTVSTVSAGAGGLLTPVQSSASSSSGSSGVSTSSSGSSEGRALLRKELEEYFEGGDGKVADMSSKAWAEFVNNAPSRDSSRLGTSTPSASRPSTSPALPSPPPSVTSSRFKIPPMPKMPPPRPPPPTAPLPSPPNTAPPSTFRISVSPSYTSTTSAAIPIPKRPSTSPASGPRRPTYQHSYASSPEDVLILSHPLARMSRSPPRPRSMSRPTSPLPASRSPVSPGPPPDSALPAVPDMKMKARSDSVGSSGSAYSNESSELAYLADTGPSHSASTPVPAQSQITTTNAGTGTGTSAIFRGPTGRSLLNPTSSPAVIEDADEAESNSNAHAPTPALLPAPTSSLLLTSAISSGPPSSEMNVSGRKVDGDQKGKAANKKPSPALLALWERQNREMGGSGKGQGRTSVGYTAHSQYGQQPQQQRPAPIYTNVLWESPKSMSVTLSTSPPRNRPNSPPTSSRLLPSTFNQGRSTQLNPPSSSSRGPKVSPRAFAPTPLPAQVDEETASMLSLERRGELVNIAVEEDSPLEDSDLEADGEEFGRGYPTKRLSALSILSNESEDPRLSGLISSFPVTPTSVSTPQVVPFLSRPVRRGRNLRNGSDSGDADDEGWDSDVDPQILGPRALGGYGRR